MKKIIFLFIVFLFSFLTILPQKAYAEVRCSVKSEPESPVPKGQEFVTLEIKTSGLDQDTAYRIKIDNHPIWDSLEEGPAKFKTFKPDSDGTIRIDNMDANGHINIDDQKHSFNDNDTYEIKILIPDPNNAYSDADQLCMATFNVGTGDTDPHTPSQPPEKSSNPSTTSPDGDFVFSKVGVCVIPKGSTFPSKGIDPGSCNTSGNYDDIFYFAGKIVDQKSLSTTEPQPDLGGIKVSLQYFPIVRDGEWQDFNENESNVKTLTRATTDSQGEFGIYIVMDDKRNLKNDVEGTGSIAIEASANIGGKTIYGCARGTRTESKIFDPDNKEACMVFYIDEAGASDVNLPIPPLPCIEGWANENKTGEPITINGPEDPDKDEKLAAIKICTKVATAFGDLEVDPTKLIGNLFGWILGISGVVAFLIFLYAGYQLMTSAGNKEKVQGARETITSAIVGLLFIIFSIAILEFIGVDILRIPGFFR